MPSCISCSCLPLCLVNIGGLTTLRYLCGQVRKKLIPVTIILPAVDVYLQLPASCILTPLPSVRQGQHLCMRSCSVSEVYLCKSSSYVNKFSTITIMMVVFYRSFNWSHCYYCYLRNPNSRHYQYTDSSTDLLLSWQWCLCFNITCLTKEKMILKCHSLFQV